MNLGLKANGQKLLDKVELKRYILTEDERRV